MKQKELATGPIIERLRVPAFRSHTFRYQTVFDSFAVFEFEQTISSGKPALVMRDRSHGGSRSDIFFPPFPAPSQIVKLDSYWLLDLTVNYAFSSTTTAYIRFTNLLDEEYEQVYGFQTLGRSAFVGIRAGFGQ